MKRQIINKLYFETCGSETYEKKNRNNQFWYHREYQIKQLRFISSSKTKWHWLSCFRSAINSFHIYIHHWSNPSFYKPLLAWLALLFLVVGNNQLPRTPWGILTGLSPEGTLDLLFLVQGFFCANTRCIECAN